MPQKCAQLLEQMLLTSYLSTSIIIFIYLNYMLQNVILDLDAGTPWCIESFILRIRYHMHTFMA